MDFCYLWFVKLGTHWGFKWILSLALTGVLNGS